MRLKLLRIFFIIFMVLILMRLFYWQVVRADELQALAEKQRVVSSSTSGIRGLIFSSDNTLLASNKPVFLLFGMPHVVKNKEEAAKKIASVILSTQQTIDLEQEIVPDIKEVIDLRNTILEKLSQDLYWVPLYRNIDLETKRAIEKLKIEGIGFEGSQNRYYPESSSAAHILGFVGSDPSGEAIGYFGTEGFYNGELKGVSGILTEERDALGLPILSGRFYKKEPKNGHNLYLNIDRSVQYIVEKKLKAGLQKYGAKSASVIIMDPFTGAIIAMASIPSYNPNTYSEFPKEHFKNPIVADAYEPGSTFKVLVMAAGINEDLVKEDTKCTDCSGPTNISGHLIRTWNNKYQDDITMTETIIHSDNTGMVFIGKKLGVDKLYQYIENFGFNRLTGVDLQDESSPEIRSKDSWREIDLATASFGQGIAVTPIQMVRAVAAIANGGKLMEPHIVKSIEDEKKTVEIKPKIIGNPINEKTAKTITEMMVKAVEEGEAKVFSPKGFRIAGKTGTAQIPVAGHYDPNKTIASFVGFAPADNPKFVMLVRYTEPSSSIFGAETAAPTFFEIAKELFIYYKIAPTNI